MIFALLTIRPVKMDGVPVPGSSRGRPTNELDHTRFVHALGTDSYIRLDGRKRRQAHIGKVIDHIVRLRKNFPDGSRFAGFEIHTGSILNSKCVACYLLLGEGPIPAGYQLIPLSNACPN